MSTLSGSNESEEMIRERKQMKDKSDIDNKTDGLKSTETSGDEVKYLEN